MAVYAVTGKLGAGKGKAAVDQMKKYLLAGKRVATNCDLFLEHLLPENDRSTVQRIPDKPSPVDLYMIGSGNKYVQFDPIIRYGRAGLEAEAPAPKLLPGFDESHNGALVLDECGSWLNTRNFQDKGRTELLEWAIHARKYGWDVFFVMQNISQVDKQLRDSLLEYVVRLNRLDRIKIPGVSAMIRLITAGSVQGRLPRLHIGVVRLGSMPDALVVDRWVFRGDNLGDAYDTLQVFSDTYPHGLHSLLSAWHLSAVVEPDAEFVGPFQFRSDRLKVVRGRVLPPKQVSPHMTKFLTLAMIFGGLLGAFAYRQFGPHGSTGGVLAVASERVYSDKLHAQGYVTNGKGRVFVTLSDGRVVQPLNMLVDADSWQAEITPGVWIKGAM